MNKIETTENPKTRDNIFIIRSSFEFNSCGRTSKNVTYKNVPVAKPCNIQLVTIMGMPVTKSTTTIPRIIPKGEVSAKNIMPFMALLLSSLLWERFKPSVNAIMHLWITTAKKIFITFSTDDCNPIARPSNIECNDKAKTNNKERKIECELGSWWKETSWEWSSLSSWGGTSDGKAECKSTSIKLGMICPTLWSTDP